MQVFKVLRFGVKEQGKGVNRLHCLEKKQNDLFHIHRNRKVYSSSRYAVSNERILLIDIYTKNEKSDLNAKELENLKTVVQVWLEKMR